MWCALVDPVFLTSCRSLVPYSHLTSLLWKEYCQCGHRSTGLQDYSEKEKKVGMNESVVLVFCNWTVICFT